MVNESPLNNALRQFEIVESNLLKAKKIFEAIVAATPDGVSFEVNPEYEDNCRSFSDLWESLPLIDGWKPNVYLMDLDEIARGRLNAQEIGDIEAFVSVERDIEEPLSILREYHFRLNQKRKELIREAVAESMESTDVLLRQLSIKFDNSDEGQKKIDDSQFDEIKGNIDQIDFLLGDSVARPQGWTDLRRHLHFGQVHDLWDIVKHDWPAIKRGIHISLYSDKEPIPVEVNDLGDLVRKNPKGRVITKILWERMSEEQFERLIFALISHERGYENPAWLTHTKAPDRGRDMSADRVHYDSLGGTIRQRVIVQCKHWLKKSIGTVEIATLREQMKLWEPPRVDVHIIATSGRFTMDAVAAIEKQNQSDSALRIEMWPDSHLEMLLARRPAIIAEFSLR